MTTKNIKDIISIQNYCKDIIQELYNHESRPYEVFAVDFQATKIDEAIRLDIIEHDTFDDELTLSADTEDYYRMRLGQNSETNIGYIGEKLNKLNDLLKTYNIRVKSGEDATRDVKLIYRLLNQIPSILRYNLQALSSTSVFAFKNEPNFEIKLIKLQVCRDEIRQLQEALKSVDRVVDEQLNFFKTMNSIKINYATRKIKRGSAELEKSFAKLHGDIINFINQSIKDGEFIKHLKKLKQLKDDNTLVENTNVNELINAKSFIIGNVKEQRILADDRMHDYVDNIRKILKERETKVVNDTEITAINYDITKNTTSTKVLYNYPKIHSDFLAQEKDLISFLLSYEIKEEKLLGVFVRLLKNYSHAYEIDDRVSEGFIQVDDRIFLKVFSNKRGKI